jgi:hypothetical protein
LLRARIQKRQVADLRASRLEAKKAAKGAFIQRCFRGHLGRKRAQAFVHRGQLVAITRIQAWIRSNKGRLEGEAMRKIAAKARREHDAAKVMQAFQRGKISRRLNQVAPSYQKHWAKRRHSMYKLMDANGINDISLEAGISFRSPSPERTESQRRGSSFGA